MSGISPSVYPGAERDAWILSRRPAREKRDPFIPYEYFVEEECAAGGAVEPVATIFLTNRECPFRCLMCDLWRNTLSETVPSGAIPACASPAYLPGGSRLLWGWRRRILKSSPDSTSA